MLDASLIFKYILAISIGLSFLIGIILSLRLVLMMFQLLQCIEENSRLKSEINMVNSSIRVRKKQLGIS